MQEMHVGSLDGTSGQELIWLLLVPPRRGNLPPPGDSASVLGAQTVQARPRSDLKEVPSRVLSLGPPWFPGSRPALDSPFSARSSCRLLSASPLKE